MKLSVGIQHHPLRSSLLPDLIKALDPLPTEIVTDPDPEGRRSSWRTFRQVLETTPDSATHRVVIQDDAQPVPGCPELLAERVAERLDRLLALCVCLEPADNADRVRAAAAVGRGWAPLYGPHIPTVATVWPVDLIPLLLDWVDRRGWGENIYNTNDDWIVGGWVAATGATVLACVPSIVEHPDRVPSLLGNEVTGRRTAAV